MVRQIDLVKRQILSNSIEQDQTMILRQWLLTFNHNKRDPGLNTMLLSMALLAQNEFKINTKKNGMDQPAPEGLTMLDYFSHASRVIIDYSHLNNENKKRFLEQLMNYQTQFDARSSTHAVSRVNGKIIEDKGFMIGLKGGTIFTVDGIGNAMGITEPARKIGVAGPSPKDFGINIAMGGEGNTNFAGDNINGSSGNCGHLFVNFNTEHELLMVGLEQTMPGATSKTITQTLETIVKASQAFVNSWWIPTSTEHASTTSLSSQDSEDESNDNHHVDQFDQGHSMIGASDTYTAAGSLYFSDLIYKLKLYHATGALTPTKYRGMVVTLDDQGFDAALNFVAHFNSIVDKMHDVSEEERIDVLTANLIMILKTPPLETKIANQDEKNENLLQLIDEITEKDLKHYFKQVSTVFLPTKFNDKSFKTACDELIDQCMNILKEIKLWKNKESLPSLTSLHTIFNLREEFFNLVDDSKMDDITGFVTSISQLTSVINQSMELLDQQALDMIHNKIHESSPTCKLLADVKILLDEYKKDDPDKNNQKHQSIALSYSKLEKKLGQLQQDAMDNEVPDGSYIMRLPQSPIVQLADLLKSEKELSTLVNQDVQSLMIIRLANEVNQYKLNTLPTFRSNQALTLFAKNKTNENKTHSSPSSSSKTPKI